jgi:UrcA family protein
MNHRYNQTLRVAAAAVLALAAAPPASAQESVAVSVRDLDLTRSEGIAVLDGRLRAASRTVCGAPEREELRAFFARRDCYRAAIARATLDAGLASRRLASLRQQVADIR